MASATIHAAAQAFGIGTPKILTSADALSDISAPGLYSWANPAPADAPFTYGRMIVIQRSSYDFTQYYFHPDTGAMCSRQRYSGAWKTMRWADPPLVAGTEYLLSEQYRGKDVYCKCLIFGQNDDGSIPANTTDTKQFVSGLANPGSIIRGYAYGNLSSTAHILMPFKDTNNHEVSLNMYYNYSGSTWRARMDITTNSALTNVYGVLYYTKD